MAQVIDNFRGEYRFLSNFYSAPFLWAGSRWPTSEHAYQASKTLNSNEKDTVWAAATPGQAKRLGRRVTKREDWDFVKVRIMREILEAKFVQNPDLMERLKTTGNAELVEGNTWGDTFWGVCNGVGENWLGKILMEVRDNASS
jgi:ribA/ribD-fused uncharacterized protein